MQARAIRSSFLRYFEERGHRVVPSSPLVPADDPTLLFTNAGMNQFKEVFLGRERRDYRRAASVQKCMRVSGKHNDLENVGPSLRHHTFFEMLGNFSFGDYFKAEAIAFAWELLTDVWQLPAGRLHPTIFGGEAGIPRDEEAHAIWRRLVPADRITELGLGENFWAMGDTGPCGRCSEIHYFRGAGAPCPAPVCLGPACDCDRYVEVWNNVFMEFDRQADGGLPPLPAPSIDTGMGLERIAAVIQGRPSNYDTDLFTPVLDAIGGIAGTAYGAGGSGDVSMRVIADHVRAATFLIADGVMPSNEWRGYVLRKIMRRAMRHGKHLGVREPMLSALVDVLVREMGDAYPELRAGRDAIVEVVRSEEARFDAVLNAGLPRLEEALERAAAGSRGLAGSEIFRLYDTLGLPVDFIEDLADQRGVALDRDGFERALEGQRERGRAGSAFETGRARDFSFASPEAADRLRAAGDRFEGYTTTRLAGIPILGVFDEDRRQVPELREGQSGFLVIERTPFYVEAGGQVSDTGEIRSDERGAAARVTGLVRLSAGWPRAHRVEVTAGSFRDRDLVAADVDEQARDAIRRNHTATHLLHAALRQVLGGHVKQAGSLVAPDRLRFDFVHFAALAREQIEEIERLVNAQIWRNTPLQTEVRATREAIAAGAVALFGEKYGDQVRVVAIPGFSLELCGGTHCRATGDVGAFVIAQETGVAAGVRRLEALTGEGALRHYQARRAALDRLVQALGVPVEQAPDLVGRLQADLKRLARENEQLNVRLATSGGRAAAAGGPPAGERRVDVDGIPLVFQRVAGLEKGALRGVADASKDRLGSGVVIVASENDGKVALVVSVTKDLAGRLHAGRIVREIAPVIGGSGGGRPDFAEAGGRDASRIDDLLARAQDVVKAMAAAPSAS